MGWMCFFVRRLSTVFSSERNPYRGEIKSRQRRRTRVGASVTNASLLPVGCVLRPPEEKKQLLLPVKCRIRIGRKISRRGDEQEATAYSSYDRTSARRSIVQKVCAQKVWAPFPAWHGKERVNKCSDNGFYPFKPYINRTLGKFGRGCCGTYDICRRRTNESFTLSHFDFRPRRPTSMLPPWHACQDGTELDLGIK